MSDSDTTRVYVNIHSQEQWYNIIRDANQWFGRGNWRGQKHIRRKLLRSTSPMTVWFEVPDAKFASFIQLKYANHSPEI